MRFKQTRSQPDSGVPKNQSNPTQPNIQAQTIRPQNISNINNKPIERNVQQAPNYQPQQQPTAQQQQNYRLPAGQNNYQQNPATAQPVIRPPVSNPGVRQVINPNQSPPVRNIPPINSQPLPIRPPINPSQQPQYRPPPPQQQQFQRPNFPNQVPLEQPQFRPQLPQVRPPPIRNPVPVPNTNMMSEINREKTFTTSHEASLDDDDDVVVGRMVTPQARPVMNTKPAENFDQRPRETTQQVMPPQQVPRPVQPPAPMPSLQRRESVQSIPSRPPSGLGSNNSQSPEPRFNPAPAPTQSHQVYSNRMEPGNRNPNEMNRQSPNNYEHSRDPMDGNDRGERVQRPMNQPMNVPQQRQSPEEHIQRQTPKINQQPMPPQQQFRPAQPGQQMPDIYTRQTQDMKKPQAEPFTQPLQQQATQDIRQNPSAMKTQDQKRNSESRPQNSVRLDLGKSDMKSANDKSPSSKRAS